MVPGSLECHFALVHEAGLEHPQALGQPLLAMVQLQ